jgi:hypothetical protein
MEEDKLNLLLDGYHNFCMELIKRIPPENMHGDEFIQKALRYRYKMESYIMELEIKVKKAGKNYISKEIENLKKELENK